jgi:hypothetical protein
VASVVVPKIKEPIVEVANEEVAEVSVPQQELLMRMRFLL